MGVGKEVITQTPQFIEATATLAKELAEALLEVLERGSTRRMINALSSHHKDGGSLDVRFCKGFTYSDISNKLSSLDIPHSFTIDKETGNLSFTTRDIDRDIVDKAILEITNKELSYIDIDDFNNLNAGETIASVPEMTEVQVKFLREQANKNHFVITSKRTASDLFTVLYNIKDESKVMDAFKLMSIEMAGNTGKSRVNAINNEITRVSSMMDRAKDPSQNFYIVSAYNPKEYVHVTGDDFSVFRNKRNIYRENRNSGQFMSNLYSRTMGLVDPVAFSAEDFYGKTEAQLVREGIMKLDIDVKDKAVYKKENAERMAKLLLVEMKFSLDNGDIPENVTSFYDERVPFSEFFEHELVNDGHEIEEAKRRELLDIAGKIDALSPDEKEAAYAYVYDVYNTYSVINLTTAIEQVEDRETSEYEFNTKLDRDTDDLFV